MMEFNPAVKGFDFIGDIHGCYDELEQLLIKLGYHKTDKGFVYSKPEQPRMVVFLGDVVDRGPGVREVLHCVYDMVENGQALFVLGNHEFHACCFDIESPMQKGEYIRQRSKKNTNLLRKTHQAFVDYPDEWEHFKRWLLQQAIFIEHPQFRAVHACWDLQLIEQFKNQYQTHRLSLDIVKEYADHNSFAYEFLERTLRGIELQLPNGMHITGSDGNIRNTFRANFWHQQPQTFEQVIFRKNLLPEGIEDHPINAAQQAQLCYYGPQERPLFLGHYWQQGKPHPLTDNIACVDYSAVRGGKLTAYRFDGEQKLDSNKFVFVEVLLPLQKTHRITNNR